ncbi:MAG: glutamate racemase [Chlorobi bacterium]|nr:glutamate racemase [Chlorobiota bacterium]
MEQPIGIFDSGVGGLSVWKEVVQLLPNESIVYFADSLNCPYGSKKVKQIIELTDKSIKLLLKENCKLIIVACNTATAAAINYLRTNYKIPFVGMEPATKPAAIKTQTNSIGILATEGTFNGELFKNTSNEYAKNISLHLQIGYGLVELVEDGFFKGDKINKLLKKYLLPMLENNADNVVLGCTHFPFLKDSIQKIVGDKVRLIDPAPAIAKRTKFLLEENELLAKNNNKPKYSFFTTGNNTTLQNLLKSFKLVNNPEIIELKSN